jgi:DNA-binding winged helix-turn-helix (wHTH) protein/tetratricopeptide (TPR) repeat protein
MAASTNSQSRMVNEPGAAKLGDTGPPTHLGFESYDVDLLAGVLRSHGLKVRLPYQSFQILAMLLRSQGQIVTREELRRELWPGDVFVDFERGLNSAMQRLRGALHDSPREPRYIETLPKQGYRFIATVASLPPASAEIEAGRHSAELPLIGGESAKARDSLFSRSKIWRYVAAAVLIVSLTAYGWRHLARRQTVATQSRSPVLTSPVIVRQSVAVLGFRNAAGLQEASWLSTALTEMLTTEMAGGDHFRTIAEEQVTRAKRDLSLGDRDSYAHDTLNRIHTYLGCDYVVVGSYLALERAGRGQLRLDARVQNAASGETIASVAVTGAQSDLFDLVSRAGEELRAKLGIAPLTPPQSEVVRAALPADLEAARLYSQALDRQRNLDNLAARDLLKKVVERQPDFAPGYSALAMTYYDLGYSAPAKAAAQKAMELRASLPVALRLEAEADYREMNGQWPQAVDLYRQLQRLYPDNLDYGLQIARAQNSMGDNAAAAKTLAALHNLPAPDRDNPRIDLDEAVTAGVMGDYKRERALAETVARNAEASGARWLMARATEVQGWALDDLGELDKAEATYARAQQMFIATGDVDESALVSMNIGLVVVKQGHLKDAESRIEQAAVVFRRRGDQARLAAALSNLGGDVYLSEGEYPKAEHVLHEALAIFNQIGELGAVTEVNYNIAQAEEHLGKLPEADERLQGLVEQFRRSGQKGLLGGALDSLGSIAEEAGDMEGALQHYREAVALFRGMGDKAEYANAERHMARALILHGDNSVAAQELADGLATDQSIDAKPGAALDRVRIAEVSLEQGKFKPEDVETVRAAIEELRAQKMTDDEIEAEIVLIRQLLQRRNDAAAAQTVRQLDALSARSFDPIVRFDAALITARVYEMERRFADSTRTVKSAVAYIEKTGCVRCQLEARLERGEIESQSGNTSRGSLELREVADEAQRHGFGLMVQRADAGIR